MPKLEILLNNSKHTLKIKDQTLYIFDVLTLIEDKKDNYERLKLFYRDRIPNKYNDSLIQSLDYQLTQFLKENYSDIQINILKDKNDRSILEMSAPKEKYTIRRE